MSKQPTLPPDESPEAASGVSAGPQAGTPGVSGQGAGSALARLREIEQLRDGESQQSGGDAPDSDVI